MTIPNTRPLRSDPAIRIEVAKQLAEDCGQWDMQDDATPACIKGWVNALLECRLSDNGYEIARNLEDYHSVSPDAELVEILDSASSYVWSAHENLVKAWVTDNGITAPLSVGQAISCRHGEGLIVRLNEESARYIFQPYGKEHEYSGKGSGILVEYEAAQAIEARRAETGTGSVHESAVPERNAPDA